jgi:hypothetical protein
MNNTLDYIDREDYISYIRDTYDELDGISPTMMDFDEMSDDELILCAEIAHERTKGNRQNFDLMVSAAEIAKAQNDPHAIIIDDEFCSSATSIWRNTPPPPNNALKDAVMKAFSE